MKLAMKLSIFLLVVLNLAFSAAFSFEPVEVEIIDLTDNTKLNNDSLHDDILELPFQRSTLIGSDQTRWTSPVPYVLDKSLDLNAKGIILRAFDQFRLKSCIDFKPQDADVYYISIQKLSGCYSYIGRQFANGQVLSIGAGCDTVAIVEHEILHALGFYHEQSRYDRDDFVTIVWDNIIKGNEHNFNKASSDISTTHGTPYDYISVMHYSKDAFTNGNGSTIITIDPKFQNVIGQRLEMSHYDVLELNRLYNCNSTIAFNMYCGFSNGTMCSMDRCSQGGISWELVTQVSGGPNSDHTTLPSGSKDYSGEIGYFMHVSTATGQEGDTAQLETQRMTPQRDCPIQCLQFYYYHSGNESDILNIWIREFENEWDFTGTRRLMGQITGSQTSHWRLHHVSLDASKNFQVVFEARKRGHSTGGFSIDDINLYETECPHVTLQIDDFQRVLNTSASGSLIYSSRQYSSEGYAYRFAVIFYQTYVGLFMQLLSGDYDNQLEWPCLGRQMLLHLLDQTPNIQQQMSKRLSFTTDKGHPSEWWSNPRETGSQQFVDENNQVVYGGPLIGYRSFASLEETQDREFLKGGSAIFALNFQDLNPLVNGSSLQCPQVRPMNFTSYSTNDDGRPCSWTSPRTPFPMTRPPATNGPFVQNTTKYPSTSPSPTDKVDERTTPRPLLPMTRPPTTNRPFVHDTTKHPSTSPNPTDKVDDRTTPRTKIPMTRPPVTNGSFVQSTTEYPSTSPNPLDKDDDSIFCRSPDMMPSVTIIFLLVLMILVP